MWQTWQTWRFGDLAHTPSAYSHTRWPGRLARRVLYPITPPRRTGRTGYLNSQHHSALYALTLHSTLCTLHSALWPLRVVAAAMALAAAVVVLVVLVARWR